MLFIVLCIVLVSSLLLFRAFYVDLLGVGSELRGSLEEIGVW